MSDRASYDALDALNWSRLRLLEKSPAHYVMGYGDDSSGFALGTATHMAILEPERFAAEYVVTDIRRDKRTKKWNDFEAEQLALGKTILIRSEYNDTIAMRDAVFAHPKAMSYLSGGASEQTLTWELGDYKCKGRADYIGPKAIVDLKSTKDCSPREFAKSCARYGYFGQAAWYSDGLRLSRGLSLPYVIVAVDSSPPHIVTVYRIPEHVIAAGREQYLTLLGRLDYCRRANFWGGYVEADEVDIEMPRWSGQQESAE